MINYETFYRRNGLLRLSQLKGFKILTLDQFIIPQGAAIHNFSFDQDAIGIELTDPLLHGFSQNVAVEFVNGYSLQNPFSSPMQVKKSLAATISTYYSKRQKIENVTLSPNLKSNPNVPLVYNYNLVEASYRYPVQRYDTHIGQWLNRYNTFLDLINAEGLKNNKQHFIRLDVPLNLPAPSDLRKIQDGMVRLTNRYQPNEIKRDMIDDLRQDNLLFIMDIWLWLGPYTKISYLSKLSMDHLRRLNIIFVLGNTYAVINMARLFSWVRRKPVPDGVDPKQMVIQPMEAQKRFLHFLLLLGKSITLTEEEINSINDEAEQDEIANEEAHDPVVDANLKINTNTLTVSKLNIKVKDIQRTSVVTGKDNPMVSKNLKPQMYDGDLVNAPNIDVDVMDMVAEELDSVVDADLQQLEFIAAERKVESLSTATYKAYTPPEEKPESAIEQMASQMARKGLLSAAELRRATALANKYKSIPSPYGGDEKLSDLLAIDEKDLKIGVTTPIIADLPGVLDKSMLSSSLKNFDNVQINKLMKRDFANVVMSLQKVGVSVSSYEVNEYEDLNDHFEEHVIKLIPLTGKPSTIRFPIPKPDKYGVFKTSGTKYRMRKQYSDVPIRKISPSEVSLTSYYSKMFVERSARATVNYTRWICNQLTSIGINAADERVTDIRINNVFTPDVRLPSQYTAVASQLAGFTSKNLIFNFDYVNRDKVFSEENLAKIPEGCVAVAKPIKGGGIVYMDGFGDLQHIGESETTKLGDLETYIGLDVNKRPIEMAEIEIFGKKIPVGVLLAFYVGLGNLLKTLKIEPKRIKRGNHYTPTADEFVVKFEDEILVFDRRDKMACLLMNGFNRYKNDISRQSVYLFDQKDIYSNILDSNGIGVRYIREYNFMFKMWVDHFTKALLIEMGEPTDLFELMISAVRKLTYDSHKHPMATRELRIKGYERFAGIAYSEIIKAARIYASRPGSVTASVDLNPYAVKLAIQQDQTVMPIEESNPIHSLKEQEVVVFRGGGGRSAQSMNAAARIFHSDAVGTVSEANTDNGDVGTINYLTADPSITSYRGLTRDLESIRGNSTKVISTTMLLSPGLDRDSSARVSFASIQNSASIHTENYTAVPLRTGYERVLIHRVNPLFGQVAEQGGEVVGVTDKVLTVKYNDDTIATFELGRIFGKWSGKVIPHELKTKLKVGAVIAQGDLLIYNDMYFQPDTLYPNQALYKPGMMARTVFMDVNETFEDSSAISEAFAKRMTTIMTHCREIKVPFDHHIRNLVKIGDEVDVESILCTLHPDLTGSHAGYDDNAISALNNLSTASPRAKYGGKIEKIDVIYSGAVEDMSESLRLITEKCDTELYRHRMKMKKRAYDGYVDPNFRVNNVAIGDRTAIVKVYITGPVPMGIGDKLVFMHQMKSIVGTVHGDDFATEDGTPLDAAFPYDGVMRRIVESAIVVSTTDTLLMALTDLVVKAAYSK